MNADKFIYTIIIILISLTFIGCAKKIVPLQAYELIKKDKATEISNLKAEEASLKINKPYLSALTVNDSILKYGTNNLIYSNYKAFAVELEPNKKYKLTISSSCDCFGFSKYMFVPLTDVSANGIQLKIESQKDIFDYRYDSLTLNKSWIINTDTAEHFKIIVYSDNTNLNHDIFKYIVTNFPMTIPIKTSLVGKFQ